MFENREGQRVPAVTFRTRDGADWKDLTSDELFAGKTVIVFAAGCVHADLLVVSCAAIQPAG